MEALILHPHWAHMLLIIPLYHSHIIGVPDKNNCIILLNLSNLTNGVKKIGRGVYSFHLFETPQCLLPYPQKRETMLTLDLQQVFGLSWYKFLSRDRF